MSTVDCQEIQRTEASESAVPPVGEGATRRRLCPLLAECFATLRQAMLRIGLLAGELVAEYAGRLKPKPLAVEGEGALEVGDRLDDHMGARRRRILLKPYQGVLLASPSGAMRRSRTITRSAHTATIAALRPAMV